MGKRSFSDVMDTAVEPEEEGANLDQIGQPPMGPAAKPAAPVRSRSFDTIMIDDPPAEQGDGDFDLPSDPNFYMHPYDSWGEFGSRTAEVVGQGLARGVAGLGEFLIMAIERNAYGGDNKALAPYVRSAVEGLFGERPNMVQSLYDSGLLDEKGLPRDDVAGEQLIGMVSEYVGASVAPGAALRPMALRGAGGGAVPAQHTIATRLTGKGPRPAIPAPTPPIGAPAPGVLQRTGRAMVQPYATRGGAAKMTALEAASGASAAVGGYPGRKAENPLLELGLALPMGFLPSLAVGTVTRGGQIARVITDVDPEKAGAAIGATGGALLGGSLGGSFGGPPVAVAGAGGGAILGSVPGRAGGRLAKRVIPRPAAEARRVERISKPQARKQLAEGTGTAARPERLGELIDESDDIQRALPGAEPTLSQRLEPVGGVPADRAARKIHSERQTAAKSARTMEQDLYRSDVEFASRIDQRINDNYVELRRAFENAGEEVAEGGNPNTPHQAFQRYVDDTFDELDSQFTEARSKSEVRQQYVDDATAQDVAKMRGVQEDRIAKVSEGVDAAIGDIRPQNSATVSSQIFYEEGTAARAAWRARVNALGNKLDEVPQDQIVDFDGLRQKAGKYVGDLDAADMADVPVEIRNLALDYDPDMPLTYAPKERLSRLVALDRLINNGLRKAKKAVDGGPQRHYENAKRWVEEAMDELDDSPIMESLPAERQKQVQLYREMRRAHREGAQVYRDNRGRKVFGRNVREYEPSRALGNYASPNRSGGSEGMREFNDLMDYWRANGDAARAARADTAMREYMMDLATTAYDNGGANGAKHLRKFVDTHSDAIDQLPGLRKKLMNGADKRRRLDTRNRIAKSKIGKSEKKRDVERLGAKQEMDEYVSEVSETVGTKRSDMEKSTAALYAGVDNIDEAMEEVLRSPTQRKARMRNLMNDAVDAARKSGTSVESIQQGLRRSFWDFYRRQVFSDFSEDVMIAPELHAKAGSKFIERYEPVMEVLYGSDHVANLKKIFRGGEVATRNPSSTTRPRLQQARDLEGSKTTVAQQLMMSTRMTDKGRAPYAMDVVTGLMQKFPDVSTQELIAHALLSPEAAKTLSTTVTNANKSIIRRRVHGYLAAIQKDNQVPARGPTEEETRAMQERVQGTTALP